MSKEIGKLIELFKEYVDNHGTDTKDIEREYGVVDYGLGFQYGTREYLYETIISKKFGFIKRLIENDKTDIEGKLNANGFEKLIDQSLDGYFPLLMLLAIQDEPISFLISILK